MTPWGTSGAAPAPPARGSRLARLIGKVRRAAPTLGAVFEPPTRAWVLPGVGPSHGEFDPRVISSLTAFSKCEKDFTASVKPEMEVSKSEFAAMIGVVPSRITKMIADGIIGADALVGTGRSARIRVELAKSQIAARRHVGQALGNGLGTRVSGSARADETGDRSTPAARAMVPSVADEIQLERLEFERRRNRRAAIDEATAAGRLVPIDDFNREVGRVAGRVVAVYSSLPADLANALAPHSSLSLRELQHLLGKEIEKRRAAAAAEIRAEAEALPETEEVTL